MDYRFCFSCHFLAPRLASQTMDRGIDDAVPPRQLKGFRLRWRHSQASSSDGLGPGECEPALDETDLFGPNLADEPLDLDSNDQFLAEWEQIELFDEDCDNISQSGLQKHLELDEDDFDFSVPAPQVLDPQRAESAWKAAAFEADLKRRRLSYQKLPWELEGSAFRNDDKWQGTFLASFDKRFASTCVGAEDVWNSKVVQSRPVLVSSSGERPVVPISLKGARREPVDEDIRRRALLRFRDIILQDPLATQLGSSLHGSATRGSPADDIDQSFRDCFRLKASTTLQKRASSLWKLTRNLREIGQLHPLRMSEAQLYVVLCNMRDAGCGATSAQHIIEALHFLDATAKLIIININEIISARCRGVARDLYLMKDPLSQKVPLTIAQVRTLELQMSTLGTMFQCILGQLLFCIHSCCRWRDSQRLKAVTIESGHGEILLCADALSSKTALTAEAKTRFLPYAAIGTGISNTEWAKQWLEARESQGLVFADFTLPSFSERHACWLDCPMSASEATAWLRAFLHGSENFQAKLVGSHSCKTTLLTWVGRCTRVNFSQQERRLLGHHLDPGMKSVLCYSRESFTALYSKVLGMFRMIRSGEYKPDLPAIDRVVQMADAADEDSAGAPKPHAEEVVDSDSDSSIASMDEKMDGEGHSGRDEGLCISLFPSFPGVSESDLFVRNVSGLVHVVNEDDTMLCGRPTSINFTQYSKVTERDHLAGCRQCLRSFQARKT